MAVTDTHGMVEFESELASRLGSYIKRAEQALMAEKTRVLRQYGLTVAQYSALMLLDYVPEASAAQLSRACMVTPQTMATILGNLEQKALVTRKARMSPFEHFGQVSESLSSNVESERSPGMSQRVSPA